MNTEELTNHIDQLIRTASSEGAKATIDHLLDLRNLITQPTK